MGGTHAWPTHPVPPLHPSARAAAITAATEGCGGNTTNIQIAQELCLPGYIQARCEYVLRTGAWMDGAGEGWPGGRAVHASPHGSPAHVPCPLWCPISPPAHPARRP